MSPELSPELQSLLTGMQATLTSLRSDMTVVLSELKAKPVGSAKPRESFSVEEAASLMGKSAYTVRQWCNLGRIVAGKRSERRGGSALWSIAAEEIVRYQDEGLLPIDVGRNVER